MARINLLPWREQLREERRKRFLTALVGVLVVSVGIVLITDQYISRSIDHQVARNAYVNKEIAQLDSRIKQISDLKALDRADENHPGPARQPADQRADFRSTGTNPARRRVFHAGEDDRQGHRFRT